MNSMYVREQWEYAVISFPVREVRGSIVGLNNAGLDGWEAYAVVLKSGDGVKVSTEDPTTGDQHYVYFKRRVRSPLLAPQ